MAQVKINIFIMNECLAMFKKRIHLKQMFSLIMFKKEESVVNLIRTRAWTFSLALISKSNPLLKHLLIHKPRIH